MSDAELARLRDEMRALDRALVELAARRVALARRVGERKRELGLPIRNYAVEAEALRLARDTAAASGLSPGAAEDVLKRLIRESLHAQERDRAARAAEGRRAGRALVVGGAGNMGRWFVGFLESQGFEVEVADPRGAPGGRPLVKDVAAEAHRFDLVLVAAPPSETAGVLRSLAGRTRGLVVDIASLKTPVADALRELAKSGARVASLHPMWGPGADLLASRNVVVCDCGDAEAAGAARTLFADTAANVVDLPLDAHDAYMATTLGLPHAVSLVYARALATGGRALGDVARLGGPTFEKQTAVAAEVAAENKDLYYEIQRLNPHTRETLDRLRRSLDELEAALAARPAFREYMASAERYFHEGKGDSA